jgi:hypothetical protein
MTPSKITTIFRLQQDIVTSLRDHPPSTFCFGPIPPGHFLRAIDDLYWLLRTPGLSALNSEKFTFTDSFSWTSVEPAPRILFHSTRYWPFSVWDYSSRAQLLLAVASTMLGSRAFNILRRSPYYPTPSACYPFDWIFPGRCIRLMVMSF